jgi:hypothetical protein
LKHDALDMKHSLLVAMIAVAVAFPVVAQASLRGYAGISQAQAVKEAKVEVRGLIVFAVGIGAFPVTKEQAVFRRLNASHPVVSRSTCNGKEVWKVTWPNSDAVVVGKGIGPQLARYCS